MSKDEIKDPIETLRRALCPAGNCGSPVCADASKALGELEAVVESLRHRALAMKRVAQHLRAEEVSVSLEADDLDSEAAKALAALAPFQVKP